MSAELLREAAAAIRKDYTPPGASFEHAVADRLIMSADHLEGRGNGCASCVDKDIEVARAYIEECT